MWIICFPFTPALARKHDYGPNSSSSTTWELNTDPSRADTVLQQVQRVRRGVVNDKRKRNGYTTVLRGTEETEKTSFPDLHSPDGVAAWPWCVAMGYGLICKWEKEDVGEEGG